MGAAGRVGDDVSGPDGELFQLQGHPAAAPDDDADLLVSVTVGVYADGAPDRHGHQVEKGEATFGRALQYAGGENRAAATMSNRLGQRNGAEREVAAAHSRATGSVPGAGRHPVGSGTRISADVLAGWNEKPKLSKAASVARSAMSLV